jgi:hypothetical protein
MPKVSAPQPVADKSGDNIIKIIEAASQAKQSQIELQKQLMLDEIARKRNREDKQLEQQDQMNNWGKMMGGQDQPQGDPVTNNSGIANSATPSQIVSPVGGAMPPGGYTPQQSPPKSMAPQFSQPQAQGDAPVGQPSQGPQGDVITIKGGSGKFMNIQLNGMSPEQAIQNAKQTGQNLGIYNTQEEAQSAIGGTQAPSQPQPQAQQQEQPSSQLKDLGFSPIGLYELGKARGFKPEAKDHAYIQALNKAKQGIASEGELSLIRDFNGYKDKGTTVLPGIDTVNLSPEMIQEELQKKNPAHYAFLKSIKDGDTNLSGRQSKEIQKTMEEVQAMWPGTNMTMVQSRIKTRNDFTSGKESQNIKSLNTAIGHLDSLHKIIPELHNTDASLWNASAQGFSNATGIGLNPAIRRFQFTKNALSGELASVFKSTGGTDTEIKNIAHNISEADSPKNLEEVTRAAVDLIGSRLVASESKWKNTFFLPDDPEFPVLNDKSREIMSRLGGEGQNPGSGPMDGGGQAPEGTQEFNVGGQIYHIPNDQVANFKKKAGIK